MEWTTQLVREIHLQSQDEAVKLLGRNGEIRRWIQQEAPVRIIDRGAKVVIVGNERDTSLVGAILDELLAAVRTGHVPNLADVAYVLNEARRNQADELGHILSGVGSGLRKEIAIKPRTRGQMKYLDAIKTHAVTIAIGPAGTGKTLLAMAAAVSALMNKEVHRLVLTRPAVEAGESLGFLPGDLQQKVNPYLRPLYDALYSMVDLDRVQRMIEREMIEVAPLAFMRGRTLSHSFAILDEAQNTTNEQMKMFLTRLGEGSRAVITGDVTQIDLPKGVKSGLVEAQRIFRSVEGVAIVHLSRADVVRHPLVQEIVDAYEADSEVQRAARRTNASSGVSEA
ncbi:MAG TPA: PhoH family protein [Candidatus Hydrogenedentes bacterium]|nr:PhoH family protein [Candidatus Hydrogenedentota bacterium]HOL78124.1 PhoH family protein [Candidatus Hydrogenedentota bacterium]HPO85588.1 PhoH family protein [Candidatus Hydrogenedentota bacterium]